MRIVNTLGKEYNFDLFEEARPFYEKYSLSSSKLKATLKTGKFYKGFKVLEIFVHPGLLK